MATMTITIPDAQINQVINDLCLVGNYSVNQLAGETQAQFAKRMVRENIKTYLFVTHKAAVDLMQTVYDEITVT